MSQKLHFLDKRLSDIRPGQQRNCVYCKTAVTGQIAHDNGIITEDKSIWNASPNKCKPEARMKERIAEIDKMFDEATSWGSWMAEASKERQAIVETLNEKYGENIAHRYLVQITEIVVNGIGSEAEFKFRGAPIGEGDGN